MLRDITIGQYYQTESVIHSLDPRVKLMGTMVFIISLFIGRSVWMYLAVTLFLFGVIKLSKVPLQFIIKGLKAVEAYHNKGGHYNSCIYGYKASLSDYGFFSYDSYNNP